MPPHEGAPAEGVPAELAFRAALECAQRTQRQLILTEAQVAYWRDLYERTSVQLGDAEARVRDLEWQAANRGVTDDGADPVGYAGAVGQAD